MYGLGAILLVALTICSCNFSNVGGPSFIVPLGVAGIAYLLAIRELFATPKFPRRVVVIGLVLAPVIGLVFVLVLVPVLLFVPPPPAAPGAAP